jgi:hypothetical protein
MLRFESAISCCTRSGLRACSEILQDLRKATADRSAFLLWEKCHNHIFANVRQKTSLRVIPILTYYVNISIWHPFWHSLILPDICFYFLSGILLGLYSHILSAILSDLLIDILPGIYSNILSDILSGFLRGIYSDILSRIPSHILSDILSDILFWHSILASMVGGMQFW